VHDTVNIEAAGIPMVFIASTEFVDAADAQSTALGADPARVFVPHPIQDRTDDELRALADGAIDAIVDSLIQQSGGASAATEGDTRR
jgi:alkanesulfonate monooxygenase SsuD/methylene tetrahydromethanopterin reductase-like flavin-dependent oxidoreductase (luciferase family)